MRQIHLPAFSLLLLFGCAPSPGATGPWPPPDPTIQSPPQWTAPQVTPTRSAAECVDLVARVRAKPDSFASQPPVVHTLEASPGDPPPEVKGKTIRLRVLVDEHGAIVRDSTTLAIRIRDRGYEGRLRASVAHFRFRPAVFEGCAVPAHAVFDVTNVGDGR